MSEPASSPIDPERACELTDRHSSVANAADERRRGGRTSTRPLDGVLVLELGNYIAAPTAGRLLADFGADVIKIERPGRRDEICGWRSHSDATSMLHHVVNRGKRSVALDLRLPAGRAAVLELARRADVLLENFRPGTLERWGLGPADLDAVSPDLILARISAFGQTRPHAGRPGFAAVAEAVGGLRHLVGEQTGRRRGSASRSATRSRGSTPRSAS